MDLGNIAMQRSPGRGPVVKLVRPVKVGHSSPSPPIRSSVRCWPALISTQVASTEITTMPARTSSPCWATWTRAIHLNSAHISNEAQGWLSLHPNGFEFVFTQKHGSWLNVVETMFRNMARSVATKQELIDRIHLWLIRRLGVGGLRHETFGETGETCRPVRRVARPASGRSWTGVGSPTMAFRRSR